MMERIDCTICGRPIVDGRWGRFVRRETDKGYETIIACNLHTVAELDEIVSDADAEPVREAPPKTPDGDESVIDQSTLTEITE